MISIIIICPVLHVISGHYFNLIVKAVGVFGLCEHVQYSWPGLKMKLS